MRTTTWTADDHSHFSARNGPPDRGDPISDRRGRPGQRTGRNIDKVAAARVLLTLVYYGLRDGHIRAPRRCTRPAAAGRGVKPASHHPRTPVLIRKWPGTGERDHRLSGMVVPSRGRASEAQAAGSKVTLKPRASSWRMWLPFYPLRHRRAPVLLARFAPGRCGRSGLIGRPDHQADPGGVGAMVSGGRRDDSAGRRSRSRSPGRARPSARG